MTDYVNKKVNFQYSKITVKIIKKIYFNNSSKVYLCVDNANPQINYCLKISSSRSDDKIACNSISSEILTMLGLKSKPNVIQIIDYYSHEQNNQTTFFILMELCTNGTLAETISNLSLEKNSFSEPQIWKIIYQVSTGLASIHANKIAHRDICSENILISLDGTYKICDFGSVTNKFYENINNNIRNEIIFDISRNTSPNNRAPEQLDLYTGYQINEKVDIWGLGIILYNMLFDSQPFNSTSQSGKLTSHKINQIVEGRIILTEEMTQSYNPQLIQILKNMLTPNPNDRISASQIVFFIDKNKDELLGNKHENKFISKFKTRPYSLAKTVSDATAKLFKRHSTQFWIIKLMKDNMISAPKYKYIKLLVNKAWNKRKKVTKVYQNISTRPIHYLSILALKSLTVIHRYIFLGPPETLSPENFNLDEFMTFFSNIWTTRYSTGNYDKEEILKNSHVTKFIVAYSEYLKMKISFHKKYPYIENNYSIENLISRNNFDFSLLIDKKLITDLISLYSFSYQKFIQIPNVVNSIFNTIDIVIQNFNEELVYLFNLIFLILIAYKNYNSTKSSENINENFLKVYDSQFLEITNKSKDYIEKIKKVRKEKNSKNVLLDYPGTGKDNSNSNIYAEYFKNLDNNLKFFPNNEFNLRSFFYNSLEKDIIGIKQNTSIGKLIQRNIFLIQETNNIYSISPQQTKPQVKRSIVVPPVENSSNSPNLNFNKNIKKDFDFSEEKFLNTKSHFDFENNFNKNVNNKIRISCPDPHSNFSIKDNPLDKKNEPARYSDMNLNLINFAKDLNNNNNNMTTNANNAPSPIPRNSESLFNFNFFTKENKVTTEQNAPLDNLNMKRKSSVDEITSQNVSSNVLNVLNDIFESSKNENTSNKNINQTKNINLENKSPTMVNYNSDLFKKIVNEMDNRANNNFVNPNNMQNNPIQAKIAENYNNNCNLSYFNKNSNANISNSNYTSNYKNDNNYNSNMTNTNMNKSKAPINNINPNINNKNFNNSYYNKQLINTNNTNNLTQNNKPINPNTNKKDPFEYLNATNNNNNTNNNEQGSDELNYESVKSQFPQMSIINIQNNYNNIKVFKEEVQIETLANEFLKEEFSKKNLQWLISSKDINYGKQIGFGGSSEVFRADYRGTEVAVKKLRILEVKEENLKEFKREVSSLIMLRHPNLVLFMGAIAEKDNICIVTEFCAGGTLFNILHQKKELIITWELRLRILLEIAIGMNFLHTNNPPIIHRDLKSLNILLTEQIERPADNTRIKISDFGLSKIIGTFDGNREQMTGQLGTCHWMAPEVIENKQYTLKADVFSYGIIIWEILTRKTPYADMSQQQISFYVTVKKGRPDKSIIPHNTPPALLKLMELCWDSEPNYRPTFSEIITYLKKIKLA